MPNAWAALALLSGAGRTNRNMIVEELYDALIEAGASEEKAKAASRAVANMERHFANIERDITDIRGTLRLHNWMLGTMLGFLIAIFFKVFSH